MGNKISGYLSSGNPSGIAVGDCETQQSDQPLRLQQLDEEMKLEREFLRRRYEILRGENSINNVGQANDDPGNHNLRQSGIPQSTLNRREVSPNANQRTDVENQNVATSSSNNPTPLDRTIRFQPSEQSTPTQSVFRMDQTQHGAEHSEVVPNLTSTQMAARNSTPKDLPVFNGDPQDWPIFYSAFQRSTTVAGYSNDENLIRLQKCLQGKAREAVRDCLMLPNMVPEILNTLKMYFGRPELILNTLIEKIHKLPPSSKSKLESLIELSFAVKNICATIKASHLDFHLNNPTLLREMLDKLSPDMALNWAIHSKNMENPNLQHFSDWLHSIAEAACTITTPTFTSTEDRKATRYNNKAVYVHTNASTTDDSAKPPTECIICESIHKLHECEDFQNLPLSEKWNLVKANELCRTCLKKHTRRCWINKLCGKNGCTRKHHELLHKEEEDQPTQTTSATTTALNNHSSSCNDVSFFRILPVTLYGRSKTIKTYALMDDGSTLTLMDESLANELEEEGKPEPLCIKWTGDVARTEEESRKIDLKISATKTNAAVYPLRNVHTVRNLKLSTETMLVSKVKAKYDYLRDIPLQSYVKEGSWHQPIATKTRLGWALLGGGVSSPAGGSLFLHKCDCGGDKELHEIVKKYFADDCYGVTPPKEFFMSKQEQRALEILENTYECKDNYFTVGLLWKNEAQEMPNSLPTALRRMSNLKNKMQKDAQLAANLQNQIDNLLLKGYATELPQQFMRQVGPKIWYLPIFIVRNPHKPTKIRLVWDAAAKTSGCALNDFLMKGPDLLRPLLHILFKFRSNAIAVSGDIAEMFHRIGVKEEDTNAQRFLWWDTSRQAIVVYKLNVLTFGASCSPCTAHFIRDKNALRFISEYPEAVNAITQHHYVDDYIDSMNTASEAIRLSKEVRSIHAQGGFHIRNWISNSKEVLDALEDLSPQENKTFNKIENTSQYAKVLGLYWDPKQDVFKYSPKFVRARRNVFDENVVPTKRELLQTLMSIYDPLGLVTCLLSYLKIILQDVWRSGVEWDQPIPKNLFERWQKWLSHLMAITNVSIPRFYFTGTSLNSYKIQLHTFVDASESAYAAVSYFRIDDGVHVTIKIVAAKSKVAPLQPLSIPRMELQAAVIGSRLTKTIIDGHNISLEKKVLWTDSKTVLNWLHNDSRQFKQYVMFRVAEVQQLTNVSEWRWVPSKLNVADIATKMNVESFEDWFIGPHFLTNAESDWPNDDITACNDKSELRTHLLYIRKNPIQKINFEYFSQWSKLQKYVSYWVLYIEKCYAKSKGQPLPQHITAKHIKKAKFEICKQAQMDTYADEIAMLKSGKTIRRCSSLRNLNVYLDDNELIRIKTRSSNLSYKPQLDFIVLPADHHATSLIVAHFHMAYHHINHETAINEVRQIFYIFKLRSLFKAIRRRCQVCKNNEATPQPPVMAPLPRARLSAFCRPFSFVGIDYFGPMLVTEARKTHKRWGVLVTCLTIRAVHIEIAHSLSTDSFLMCLRNFISRRGLPIEIYSDNATNFRGADKLLREEAKRIDFSKVHRECAFKGITWRFNPPAAPHMGGAWERLVRSIKTVLYKISPSQRFTDESLRSALMEVEMTVNSRPLTFVSLEHADDEAITPNTWLLGSSSGAKPFCDTENLDLRMNLRQSQHFANLFWKRWLREVLPTLTRRGKWCHKVKPIAVNDIVVIVDESQNRNVWLKGRVLETTIAADGQVRRAKVQTAAGVLERPAVKLAVLDVGRN